MLRAERKFTTTVGGSIPASNSASPIASKANTSVVRSARPKDSANSRVFKFCKTFPGSGDAVDSPSSNAPEWSAMKTPRRVVRVSWAAAGGGAAGTRRSSRAGIQPRLTITTPPPSGKNGAATS